MALKQLTKTYYVSDFSEKEEIANVTVYPTGKHATSEQAKGMEVEIRYPEFLGGNQSGKRLPIDPDFHDGKLEFIVRLTKGSDVYEITEKALFENPVKEEVELPIKEEVAKKV
jgi:hypothetical protein